MPKHNKAETKKLFRGSFQPTLENALAREIESYKQMQGQLAPLRICVPSNLLAVTLRRKLARTLSASAPGYTGHANLQFTTLKDLASEITLRTPVRLAPRTGLELLCAQIIREVFPANGYFEALRERKGFPPTLLETFTDLHESGVTTEALHRVARHTASNKLTELANAYAAFREWLIKNGFGLESDLFEAAARVDEHTKPAPLFFYGFYDLNQMQRRFAESIAPSAWFVPWPQQNSEFATPLLTWMIKLGYQETGIPETEMQKQSLALSVSVVSAPGETVEVREAVREIFAYVQETGRTFNDTAILFRSGAQYEVILRDTLKNCGVPAYYQGGRPRIERKDARLVLLLFETIRTGLSRRSVMELACFTGANSHWDQLSVKLKIVAGKDQWLRRVSTIAADRSTANPTDKAIAKELLQFLKKLFELIGDLPSTASWDVYVDAIVDAFNFLGGEDAEVVEVLQELKNLHSFQSTVEFKTFSDIGHRELQIASSYEEAFQGGNVFVGDVMGARGMSWPCVILLGLVEKSFPRIIHEDPLLLDEERELIDSLLPLKLRGHEEERFLFELTTATASEKLIVSYPRINPDTASPRVPSFLLLDFTGNRSFKKLAEEVITIPLSPIRHIKVPISENEFNVPTILELSGATDYMAEISPLLSYGVTANQSRWQNHSLTSYDGLILGALALQELHSRLGTDGLKTSATALEKFFQCPFYYFQKHILRTECWEEPEDNLQIAPLDLGLLYHAILERFFCLGNNTDLAETAELEFLEFEKRELVPHPTIWKMQKQVILNELRSYLSRNAQESGNDWITSKIEEQFHDVQLSGDFRLRGKIDRIDINQNNETARVIDYKTGKLKDGLKDNMLKGGQALQLPLYMLAGESLLPNQQFVAARYEYITLQGKYRSITFECVALKDRMQDIETLLKTASSMIRSGAFAQYATKGNCQHCEYRPICGTGILQLYANKESDPQMADFRDIKETIK